MTAKVYRDEFGDEVTVEEMTRKEAIEYVEDWIGNIECVPYSTDLYIWVEYNDGSFYKNYDGDVEGVFKKRNIRGVILDDGYEYYVYGEYTVDENLIATLI